MQESVAPRTTPKDFFLTIGMIVALYVSAISLLTVVFQAINALFPDALDYYYRSFSDTSALRAGVSALVVAFPLYLLLSRLVYRDLTTYPEKREFWIRRWLVYLTLFIAGVTLAINVIILVNTFLEGEITTRFVLKVAAVALVAGAVFRYYLFDLRRDLVATAPVVRRLAWATSFVVLALIVGGVAIVGTPTSQRLVRLDDRRASDLSSMQWQVLNYWQRKGELPANLNQLNDPLGGSVVPFDPATGTPYEYRILGERSFALCATFAAPSRERGTIESKPYLPPGGEMEHWEHEAGHVCFDRTIDPELYPPIDTTPQPPTIPTKPIPVR
jgi:hypothetical protein